jgi:hypothetical protein
MRPAAADFPLLRLRLDARDGRCRVGGTSRFTQAISRGKMRQGLPRLFVPLASIHKIEFITNARRPASTDDARRHPVWIRQASCQPQPRSSPCIVTATARSASGGLRAVSPLRSLASPFDDKPGKPSASLVALGFGIHSEKQRVHEKGGRERKPFSLSSGPPH